jgi:hypothetical protein
MMSNPNQLFVYDSFRSDYYPKSKSNLNDGNIRIKASIDNFMMRLRDKDITIEDISVKEQYSRESCVRYNEMVREFRSQFPRIPVVSPLNSKYDATIYELDVMNDVHRIFGEVIQYTNYSDMRSTIKQQKEIYEDYGFSSPYEATVEASDGCNTYQCIVVLVEYCVETERAKYPYDLKTPNPHDLVNALGIIPYTRGYKHFDHVELFQSYYEKRSKIMRETMDLIWFFAYDELMDLNLLYRLGIKVYHICACTTPGLTRKFLQEGCCVVRVDPNEQLVTAALFIEKKHLETIKNYSKCGLTEFRGQVKLDSRFVIHFDPNVQEGKEILGYTIVRCSDSAVIAPTQDQIRQLLRANNYFEKPNGKFLVRVDVLDLSEVETEIEYHNTIEGDQFDDSYDPMDIEYYVY